LNIEAQQMTITIYTRHTPAKRQHGAWCPATWWADADGTPDGRMLYDCSADRQEAIDGLTAQIKRDYPGTAVKVAF